MDTRLQNSTRALRIALGLMAIFAGLDKFLNLLVDWSSYVSPVAVQLSPFSPDVLMVIVGIVEIAVGVSILGVFPVMGAYVASAWLVLVSVNLLAGGHFDVAVRDIVLSIAAFALGAQLQVQNESQEREPEVVVQAHHLIT